ncbi:MAG: triphosphoribosyl-dephospho-CoA synthase [Candidatus Korobacteraceae bacterium]
MSWMSDFLEARDERQRVLDRTLERARPEDAASFLLISANVPGCDKHRPGITRLLRGALDSLREAIGLKVLFTRRDLLGPFHIASSNLPPIEAKKAALVIEANDPSARLLDLDVYRPDGSQVDRAGLGLPPRSCLICDEPARECILLRRHSTPELLERVDSLLRPFVPSPRLVLPESLAANLRMGALRELDLTPKPGLVDREDSGSHADISYAEMRASIDLLPLYFANILECHQKQRPLQDFVQAGIDAENRMTGEIQSNTHKGFIFLSGLVLMAACNCGGQADLLRRKVSEIAKGFFARFGSPDSYGADIRNRHGLGGIRAEAEQGLPAVFEHGWPKYREALEAGWGPEHAGFYLMAVLMQRLEDTTAIHRCGLDGLSRLRQDGARLQRLLEQQQEPEPVLVTLNQEYRRAGLTMGGVADCMALTFALQETAN